MRSTGILAGTVVSAALLGACAFEPRPRTVPDGRATRRIVFVGDSLVHRSETDHGMLQAIRSELARRHPAYVVEVVDAGVNGDRIADIRGRLASDVLALRPDAVVLYWDSDISDVDEQGLSPAERLAVRADFEASLRDVLGRLVASGAHVIVSGPTLIGERPRGKNEKDTQLDAYQAVTRRVAARMKVAYIDTRRAFFARRPHDAPADTGEGLLTEDGEHLNDRGVGVVLRLFVGALDRWLRGPFTSLHRLKGL